MGQKSSVAIVGSGNISTDLLYKLLRSEWLEPRWMIGIDPDSEGLARARKLGLETSHEGGGLAPRAAGEAGPGVRSHQCLRTQGRGAAVRGGGYQGHRPDARRGRPGRDPAGPTCASTWMLRTSTWSPGGRPPSRWCTRCSAPSQSGAECPTQRSSRRSRRCRPDRAPAPTSTNSPNHQQGVETIGGAKRGKAIIILNPADPPMIMRDTIFCAIPEDADRDAITKSIHDVVAEVQTYVPGYRLLNEPQFDEPSVVNGGNFVVTTFVEVEGAAITCLPMRGIWTS